MKTKNLLVSLSVAMLSISAAYAQKVEATVSQYGPVINCEGMPLSALTTVTKGQTELELKANNATVYHRFAVSKTDNSTSSVWVTAFTDCSKLGVSWRLPTQRELMLMWVLKRELELTSEFTKFAEIHYWSATERQHDLRWCMQLKSQGYMIYLEKTYKLSGRCVREL